MKRNLKKKVHECFLNMLKADEIFNTAIHKNCPIYRIVSGKGKPGNFSSDFGETRIVKYLLKQNKKD